MYLPGPGFFRCLQTELDMLESKIDVKCLIKDGN